MKRIIAAALLVLFPAYVQAGLTQDAQPVEQRIIDEEKGLERQTEESRRAVEMQKDLQRQVADDVAKAKGKGLKGEQDKTNWWLWGGAAVLVVGLAAALGGGGGGGGKKTEGSQPPAETGVNVSW